MQNLQVAGGVVSRCGCARCVWGSGSALEITRVFRSRPPPRAASLRPRRERCARLTLSANYSQSTDVLVVGLGL